MIEFFHTQMGDLGLLGSFAVMFIIAGIIGLIGITLGYPAAHWIGEKVANIFSCLPTEKYDRVLPALGIPASKAVRGDLLGAIDGYENLLIDYPQEEEIYSRLLEITLGPMNMPEYGEEVLQRGLLNLKLESEQIALLKFSQAIKNGDFRPLRHLNYRPGNLCQSA
jgi:hypothetical protein